MKRNNESALDAFTCHINDGLILLDELQNYFGNCMDVSLEEVNWGHVGSAAHVVEQLREIRRFLGLEKKPK